MNASTLQSSMSKRKRLIANIKSYSKKVYFQQIKKFINKIQKFTIRNSYRIIFQKTKKLSTFNYKKEKFKVMYSTLSQLFSKHKENGSKHFFKQLCNKVYLARMKNNMFSFKNHIRKIFLEEIFEFITKLYKNKRVIKSFQLFLIYDNRLFRI